MPAFVALPANPDDLPAIAHALYESCASDPGFGVMFPKGPTAESIQHAVAQMETEMAEDMTCLFIIAKDAMTGDIASYAIWHFIPLRSHDQIEREMLTDKFPLPKDANIEAGNKLLHLSVRKRYEVVAKHIGIGQPYACGLDSAFHSYEITKTCTDLSALGTRPKYQKQGAGSLLVQRGCERADDYNIPAYLEATAGGKAIYIKHGFQVVDQFKLELSPWKEGDFVNVCMVRPAQSTSP